MSDESIGFTIMYNRCFFNIMSIISLYLWSSKHFSIFNFLVVFGSEFYITLKLNNLIILPIPIYSRTIINYIAYYYYE